MKLDKISIDGKKTSIEVLDKIFSGKINKKLVDKVLYTTNANFKGRKAKTKQKNEIIGSTAKIWAQKGTGNARHASRKAPIFVGGGVAHGPKGQSFSIHNDLAPLLDDLAKLFRGGRQDPSSALSGPVLLTCHSPGWHHVRLRESLMQTLGLDGCGSGRLDCTDAAGRILNLGDYARWVSSGRM